MKIYVLIATDGVISGVYTSQNKLVADLTSTLLDTQIKKVEVWESDSGFIEYLKVNRQTTVTLEG